MRDTVLEDARPDAVQGPLMSPSTTFRLDEKAVAWLVDPIANDSSGKIFVIIDFAMPLAILLVLLAIRAYFPGGNSLERAHERPRVLCPDKVCRCLAWWSRTKIAGFVRSMANPDAVRLMPPPWSMQTLSRLLGSYSISNEVSDEAKQFLVEELSTGRSRLMCKEGGQLVRAVELVMVVVEFEPGRCVLQQVADRAGPFGLLPEKLPSTRRRRGESAQAAAKRCIAEKVRIPTDALKVHSHHINVMDSMESFPRHPGLTTILRKVLVHAEVVATDSALLRSLGLQPPNAQVNLGLAELTYHWMPAEAAEALMPQLRRSPHFGRHWRLEVEENEPAYQHTLLDSKLKAVLPWCEQAVTEVLQHFNVDDPKEVFGRGLPELTSGLSAGRYSLAVRESDGQLICVQDAFSLLLSAPGGQVLVDTSVGLLDKELPRNNLAKLPSDIMLANEDSWIAARQIAFSQLGIHAVDLEINERQTVQQVWPGTHALEREEQHPEGLRPAWWVFREWVILCQITDSGSASSLLPDPDLS